MLQLYLSLRILGGVFKTLLGNWVSLTALAAAVAVLLWTGHLDTALGILWTTGATIVGGLLDWLTQLATDWLGNKLTPW